MNEVVLRLNGGLGNQMFQYAFAKAKALDTGARLLLDRSMFDLPYVPEQYRLDAFRIEPHFTNPVRNALHRTVLSPKLPWALKQSLMAAFGIAIIDEDAADDLPKARVKLCVGYFQKPAAFQHIAADLQRDFLLPEPQGRAQEFLRKIQASESVAVHVRRGDYVNIPYFRNTLGVLDADYYQRAIKAMRDCIPGVRFFVFSNDLDWVARELVSRDENIVTVNLGSKGSDLIEMSLMRACRHFIVGNSTFSWWPAFLSNAPGKVVLAPSPWFRVDNLGFRARVPSDWCDLRASFDAAA